MHLIAMLDRAVAGVLVVGKWLSLPVVLALFLQWPLRDLVGAWSRDANDLGQWIFALYVAICVTAATRGRTHLAADALARSYSERTRETLTRLGALLGLIPWSAFVLIASRNLVWSSIIDREQFPDTYNNGYFLIKTALWLLALLMFAQGLIEVVRPARQIAP